MPEQPERSPHIQPFLDAFRRQFSIPDDFVEASDHPYHCRCEKCFKWWKSMGNEEEGYGPFTKEELGL